ncbi:MAG TPA: hypothetical protein VF588_16455 [Pyrinomonadaceae bacterium]|jgi:hypothetical protein
MRRRNALHAGLLGSLAAFVLAASALAGVARAQSGRTLPPPTTAPSPVREPATKFVAAPDEDKYRLVYTSGWDGPLRPDGDEAERVRHSRMNNFVARLNEAGERGYRLLSVVNGWMPVAVVELDEAQHEYGWFETAVVARPGADVLRVYTRFFNMYRKQAAGGFRLAGHFVTRRECALFSTGFFRVDERCIYKDLYLLERRKGDARPRQTRLEVIDPDVRAVRLGDELTARVRGGLAEGLSPAYVFSRFAVLLEETWAAGDPAAGAADFRVVTQTNSDRDFERAVNELARQGYRMQLNNNAVAVMRRAAADTTPAEYLWLDAMDKNFARRLAEAQGVGAVYRMTAPDGEREETRLVFERPLDGGGRRRDYRVFRVDLQFAENAAERKVSVGVSPQTRAAVADIGRLLKEGYVVRDLFWADAPHILLERAP